MTEQRRSLEDYKAVALRYKPEQDTAPTVAAKGQGILAQRIIDVARQHNIPIRRDKDLVQVLSRLDINQQIPEEVYQAVAEILAFIYKSSQQASDKKS